MTSWYVVPVRGKGMEFTELFLERYGHVLERARRPKAATLVEEPSAEAVRAALGRMAAWARETRERVLRQEAATVRSGHRPKDWRPPMTGEALRARRTAAGLTQRELAAAAGVARSALSEIESPRKGRGKATPETWERLLGALARAEAEAAT